MGGRMNLNKIIYICMSRSFSVGLCFMVCLLCGSSANAMEFHESYEWQLEKLTPQQWNDAKKILGIYQEPSKVPSYDERKKAVDLPLKELTPQQQNTRKNSGISVSKMRCDLPLKSSKVPLCDAHKKAEKRSFKKLTPQQRNERMIPCAYACDVYNKIVKLVEEYSEIVKLAEKDNKIVKLVEEYLHVFKELVANIIPIFPSNSITIQDICDDDEIKISIWSKGTRTKLISLGLIHPKNYQFDERIKKVLKFIFREYNSYAEFKKRFEGFCEVLLCDPAQLYN